MNTGLSVFDRTVQEANTWLRDVQSRLAPCDRQAAYSGLRAVLHVLRDRLPMEAVIGLSAQLPMLLRGLFLEGWRPVGGQSDLSDVDAFAAAVGERLPPNFPRQPNEVAEAVLAAMAEHLDPGETAKLARFLPARLRPLFPREYV